MAGSFLGALTGGAIGSAVVRLVLDDSQYSAGLAQAKGEAASSTAAMGASFNKWKLAAGAALGAIGTYALNFAADSITAASNQEEALNKVRVVFGETSGEVERFASAAAENLGLSETAALGAAASFGTMLESAGFATAEIGNFSVELTQLAGDLASFNNIAVDEALLKLRSGLAGEAEPLRQLGVFLSEAKVKAEAYASGIARTGAELTESQKIQARYNIILAETGKAQGDFARTSDSLANQQRILQAEFANLQAEVGQQLTPAIAELLPKLTQLAQDIGPVLVTVFSEVGDVMLAFADSVLLLQRNLDGLTPEFTDLLGNVLRIVPGMDELGKQVSQGADLWGAYRDQQEASTKATEEWYAETFKTTRLNIEEFMTDAAGAAGLLAGKESELEEETRQANEEIQRQISKMYDLRSVQIELAGGVLGLVESARTYQEAQAEVTRLEQRGKEGTAEYREAVGDLLSERLELEQQFIDFGTQLAEEDATLAEAKAALREYGQEAGLSKGALQDFLQAGLRPVRSEAERLNDELDKMDGRNVHVTVTASFSDKPDWWQDIVRGTPP